MPVGAQFRNAGGIWQIDQTSICLSLQAHAIVALTQRHRYAVIADTCRYADIVYQGRPGTTPVIALRSPDSRMIYGLETVTRDGDRWTFRVTGGGPTSLDYRLEYFIFDQPRPREHGVGLEIYSSAEPGKLLYSTDTLTMKPIGGLQSAFAGAAAAIATISWSSVENIDTEDGVRFTYRWSYIINGLGRTFTVAEQWGEGASGLPLGVPNGFGSMSGGFLIDVTGFTLL